MEEKKIVTVLDINRDYVKEFYNNTTEENQAWIEERLSYWMEQKKGQEHGERHYFAPFRAEFAKKFFPELIKKKTGKKKPTLLDELKQSKKAKSE